VNLAKVTQQGKLKQANTRLDEGSCCLFIKKPPVADHRHLDMTPVEELHDLEQVGTQERLATGERDVTTTGFFYDPG
jgi:hypothetical protein